MSSGVPASGAPGVEAFAALAVHQLGEAVALVRGAATVLEAERGRLGPSGDDALQAINAGAQRAQRFVDDLLDLARVSAPGEPEDAGAGGDLGAALRDALDELSLPLELAGARLIVDGDLPPVPLPRAEAGRLLVHLLRSGLSAGARELTVAGVAEDGHVTLRVRDDVAPPGGPGHDVFAPFAPPRGRGPLVGAGVGMLVCHRLAERRGGTITMEAADGGGTLVTVVLPWESTP